MSLIYSRNNNGPRTAPCGTPDFTGTGLDVVLSTTTVGVLLVSQLSIQVRPDLSLHSDLACVAAFDGEQYQML